MPSTRDIKNRISSVKSTEQITKAMKLVASSKVQRAKTKVEAGSSYFESLKLSIRNVLRDNKFVESAYLRQDKKIEKRLYIVLSSDKGLCGAYNMNMFKELATQIDSGYENMFITSGRKAREFTKRKGYNVIREFVGISSKPSYADAVEISTIAIDMYLKGEADEIFILYTHFKTIISQEVVMYKMFPLNKDDFKDEEETRDEKHNLHALTLYEPSAEAVLDYIIPKYMNSIVYGAMLEASASEEGSRMTAMSNATENAGEIIEDLTLAYNRQRQAGITTEITEIVGGANALNA